MDLTRALQDLRGLTQGLDASRTVAIVKQVARDPAANQTLSLFVLAGVVLIVLMVAVLALTLLTPSKKKVVRVRRYVLKDGDAAPASPETPRPQRRPSGRLFLALTSPLAVVVAILAVFLGAYVATSTDEYCARTCHAATFQQGRVLSTGHARCVSCHEQGDLALVQNSVQRVRMVVDYVVKKNPNVASVATDANVCRRCHRDLEKKVIAASTGVRMSHKETAAAALPCTTCHVSVGHTRRAFTGSMSECITCHDGRTASTECTSCHVRDPGAVFLVGEESTSTIGSGRVIYPAVRAANRNCGGCHDVVRNCDPCHGMRMPHSLEFKKSGHARAAAWGRKKMCAKCHTQADCGSPCHGTMDITTGEDGHAPNWEAEHRTAGWDAGCACHASRGTPRGTKPICTLCHDEKTHKLLPIPN